MKTIQKGFTLIELMIVVAIIAILAALAIPAYQDYVIRTQVSEGAVLSDGAKTAFAEFYSNKGAFPTVNASAGLATAVSIAGKYVTSVAVANNGKITATFNQPDANSKILNKLLVYSAITNAGSISWSCKASAGTTVDPKYLPTVCR
ncbi:pilin [Dyella soli]|uniref:Prepilin-type N-terminal cleavage/methylation domain-containing protein n=1 Tax=Dyella soli TaxID=522319 RepID=A0A4R0YZD7_9GAMM|nr:pilin [Dyella soli]TCI10944.1 prepilin-type N-terminal cleavage/methylation domain-containing protein [Dyella soli]